VDLADETLKFKGKSESKEYEVDIAFFKPVDSEGSTYNVLPRSVVMHVMKKDKEEEEFWPRLLKDKALEKNQVKIDWDRYVDEDEEEEGFDTSAVSSLLVSNDDILLLCLLVLLFVLSVIEYH
jgi:cytosolic prostaglandin-E synthase